VSNVSRVLVGYDGSPSGESALTAAIFEAAARHAALRVVHAVEVPARLPVYEDAYRRVAREAVVLAARRAAAVLGGPRVTWHVDVASPSVLLLSQARPEDLLVVGSHGHRPVARMLLGSTGAAVAAHAPCPVLVVRGPRVRQAGPVVVGVDGSAVSSAAVAFAADVAVREGTTLRAVLAVPPGTDALGFVVGPDDPEVTEARAALAEAVAGLAVEHPDLDVERVLVQTHPVEALLRASRAARLLVVGSRGLGGLRGMVLGSVSREALLHASCPVAVVRPAEVLAAAGAARR
jgi:nucleotide-binding universal stress UspA family protein